MPQNTPPPKTPRIEINGKMYLENAVGGYIPVECVSEIDLLRSDTVWEIALDAETEAARRAEKHAKWLNDMLAFMAISSETHGVKIGGRKGNVTISTHAGEYRVQIAVQTRIVFDERLRVAQQMLEQYAFAIASDAGPEIRAIISNAFQVDTEGKINVPKILDLQKIDIQDTRWRDAMQVIYASIGHLKSGTYLRVSKRNEAGKYRYIASSDIG